jgi:long-subunit fatty acid transport protein
MALPAADPVGLARDGAQVAYGYSLEAAALNPALLASLKEKAEAYLAVGLEMSSTQQSLENTQHTSFSTDRNRALGAFGLAFRVSPTLALGLKLDEPYLRHVQLLDDAPSRYLGDGLSVSARRMEGQAAWSINPNLSFGVGLGVARLSFDSSSVMRLNVPNTQTGLVDTLVEQRVGQSGSKVVPSYSLGLRWAINPRWTLGFAHQSGMKGDLSLQAGFAGPYLGLYDSTGLRLAPDGAAVRAAGLLTASRPQAGQGTLELPSQTTLGIRHRIHPRVTWEADLRWTSASLTLPTFASVATPAGTISAPNELPNGKSHFGVSGSIEVEVGKSWTLRGGLALDQRSIDEALVEPLLGGSRTASFSAGAGYRIWGGEVSLGYQYRQSEDVDTRRLDGVWSAGGYRSVGTKGRVEGMGHLLAIGFKKAF